MEKDQIPTTEGVSSDTSVITSVYSPVTHQHLPPFLSVTDVTETNEQQELYFKPANTLYNSRKRKDYRKRKAVLRREMDHRSSFKVRAILLNNKVDITLV